MLFRENAHWPKTRQEMKLTTLAAKLRMTAAEMEALAAFDEDR